MKAVTNAAAAVLAARIKTSNGNIQKADTELSSGWHNHYYSIEAALPLTWGVLLFFVVEAGLGKKFYSIHNAL